MAEQKKLSGSQIQLLLIKDMAITRARQDFQQILNMIAFARNEVGSPGVWNPIAAPFDWYYQRRSFGPG